MIGTRAAALALTGACVAGLGGCGGSSHRAAATSTAQATTPAALGHAADAASSPAQTPPAPRVSRRLKAQEATLHRQVTAALRHDSDPGARYGTLPRDLRGRQHPPANQVLQASLARPADAIQGIAVEMHLPGGSAQALGVGPEVPTRIQGTADLHTSAVWDLTFSAVHGRVPLSAGRFTITDAQGQLLRPRVRPAAGGPLPPVVPGGRPYTIVIRTRVSVGDGKLRYAPTGGRLLSEWDFDVETD